MDWLNYHHLYYFWVVAREGGLRQASPVLFLEPPTLSKQIKLLEQMLGEPLFERAGRRLVLTPTGKVVYRFASEIFALGHEMVETVKGRPTGRPLRLAVGVTDVVPKLLVQRLLEPARHLSGKVHLVVREDPYDRMLTYLAAEELDLVIADAPAGPGSRVRAFNHLLGSSTISFFAAPKLARTLKGKFPTCLQHAPMLLPTENTHLRRPLEQWLARHRLVPDVVAECEDTALMETWGKAGAGVLVAPTIVAREYCEHGELRVLGAAPEVVTSFYGLVVERRIQNAAVLAVIEQAHASSANGGRKAND